jgi:hypothetical protein
MRICALLQFLPILLHRDPYLHWQILPHHQSPRKSRSSHENASGSILGRIISHGCKSGHIYQISRKNTFAQDNPTLPPRWTTTKLRSLDPLLRSYQTGRYSKPNLLHDALLDPPAQYVLPWRSCALRYHQLIFASLVQPQRRTLVRQ